MALQEYVPQRPLQYYEFSLQYHGVFDMEATHHNAPRIAFHSKAQGKRELLLYCSRKDSVVTDRKVYKTQNSKKQVGYPAKDPGPHPADLNLVQTITSAP